MESIEFELELLSPAFVAGAMDEAVSVHGEKRKYRRIGLDSDGLRIPSLRGVLRFWFRALHAHLLLEELKGEEQMLFGGSECGQGLRFVPLKSPKWCPKSIGGSGIPCGAAEAYLGYGPILYDRTERGFTSHHKFLHRDFIPDGTKFRFRAIGNGDQLKALQRLLKIIHLFGGIGARSRRGWGALAVAPHGLPKMGNGESVKGWFKRAIEQIFPSGFGESLPKFSGFSKHMRYHLTPTWSSYHDIFKHFHETFKRVRIWNWQYPNQSPLIAKQDHELELNHLSENDKIYEVPKRLGFGFPYRAQFRGRGEVEYKAYRVDQKKGEVLTEITRRASPLILSLFRDPKGRIHGVALFLKSYFWGSDFVQMQTNKTETLNKVDVSEEAILAFLNELGKQ